MIGLLPGCFKVDISEATQGAKDYIVEQGTAELNNSNEVFNLGALESSNSKLRSRQFAFLAALKKVYEQKDTTDDLTDLLCLEDSRNSANKSFDIRRLPREPINTIEDAQKRIHSKKVVDS
jgi:hypothetical protein